MTTWPLGRMGRAISTNYRGYDIWELPPDPEAATLEISHPRRLRPENTFGSPEHVHLFTEAKKLAWDVVRICTPIRISSRRRSPSCYRRITPPAAQKISLDRAMRSVPTSAALEHGDTIHDGSRSMGQHGFTDRSNYRGMGSGMTPPGLGFVLQDRGQLFVLKDGHPNAFAPGKRPFHTIIPSFITKDGKPWISFGVMGGGMQPQGHAQIIMNLIDFGMGLQEAGDAPRIQHEGDTEPEGQNTPMRDGGEVELESGFAYETIRALMEKGHHVTWADGPYGGYQAIEWDEKHHVYLGASEGRKDGQAAGY